jgi:hypothetical protein
LLERLGEYSAGGGAADGVVLASVPPAFESIRCKPQLFDIAFNFLEVPNLDDKAGVKQETTKRGGLFGWLRG